MNVLVAGGGKVALALESALRRAADLHVSRWSRAEGLAADDERPPDVAVLAISDTAIGEVAERLLAEHLITHATVLLHTAGALAPEEAFSRLRPLVGGAGLLHPLRSIAGGPEDERFEGTVFAVAGDESGRRAALSLVAALSGTPLDLASEALARYHAAAVLASNHTLALASAAVGLLVGEGLDRRAAEQAIASLIGSSAKNVATLGLPAALTGPLARGDVATIEKHLAALPESVRPLYLATARATLVVAREKATANPTRQSPSLAAAFARLTQVLDEKS